MHQRTTGLVVGLVIFVILTVGLLSSTIYFYVESERSVVTAKNATDERKDANGKLHAAEDAYKALAGFVTGEADASPSSGLDTVKQQLGLSGEGKEVANLKDHLTAMRGAQETLTAENDSLKKQVASAQADASIARQEAQKQKEAAQLAAKNVDETLGAYKASTDRYGAKLNETISSLERAKDEAENRQRNEVTTLQRQIDDLSGRNAAQSTRIDEMQTVIEKVRIKPNSPAELVDGRIIEAAGTDGQVFINLGSKQRLQPGMVFDVYDDASKIQYDPDSGMVIPGKARIEVMKVSENTSTAHIIPDKSGRKTALKAPVVKDDVIANPIYSPNYRYKFLVHGKFDVNNDGKATEVEADYIRRQIANWGGEVVEGDTIRGDLDFVVIGVQPVKPAQPAANVEPAAYTQWFQARLDYDKYEKIYQTARESRIPVLNWNRMQVLTNEGR